MRHTPRQRYREANRPAHLSGDARIGSTASKAMDVWAAMDVYSRSDCTGPDDHE